MSMPKMPDDAKPILSNLYVLHADEAQETNSYLVVKRVIDILFSALCLFLLLPLFAVIAVLIKLDDPKGKVFFRQTRVGKDEKPFEMYKFRSMISNAEELKKNLMAYNEVSGAMFKMKNDPRITKIGKFLRKTSIDELPQLWNVLVGNMSLVGPRPPLPDEVAQYSEYDKQRLTVTPGCTGYWQVHARNSVGFEEMVQLDLTYIRMRSTALDMKIILKTGLMLLGSKNAY
ncbi:Sugar transferase involved in LPS biosynthesis (colanic, teichoic acid) [Paenibacillus sophorae]|uniref:Sugar transferase n=1 Tax=Paenibacillus sophorae TaxID=1333845 RepID=A0A1H8T9Z2_9BACL|nr:sugar transferase [Paenibacillus sophorae]QWU17149.1 sugar transferase [Paenibacillus sophorae]SEO87333.1 Sugar transferase involved in LPS biosynthesis (colanic, teichoic acid) [Paenibacillus sophorae]